MRFVFLPVEAVTQGMLLEIISAGLNCTYDSLTKNPTNEIVMLKCPHCKPSGSEIYKSYDESEVSAVLASQEYANGSLELLHDPPP